MSATQTSSIGAFIKKWNSSLTSSEPPSLDEIVKAADERFDIAQAQEAVFEIIHLAYPPSWKLGWNWSDAPDRGIQATDLIDRLPATFSEFASLKTFPAELAALEFSCRHQDSPFADHPDLSEFIREFDRRDDLVDELQSWLVGGNRYVKHEFLGEGGLGYVFLAYDTHLQRQVAIKRPKKSQSTGDAIRRFRHEAQITAQIEHPNVVSVHELFDDADDLPNYVMTYHSGVDLKEMVIRHHARSESSGKKLNLRRILDFFLQACDAIEYAHDCGILHCDLKPEHISVGNHGQVVILDWGLARARPKQGSSQFDESLLDSKSATGDKTWAAAGTAGYMAPEIIEHGPSRSTDVFALGSTLYFIVTGKTRSIERRTHEIKSNPLLAICDKATKDSAEERYSSVDQLANDIRSHLADSPISAKKDSLRAQLSRWIRNHPTVTTTFIVSVLLLSIAFGLFWLTSQANASRERALRIQRERESYAGDIKPINDLIQKGWISEARERLQAMKESPSTRSLRGPEWFLLRNMINARTPEFQIEGQVSSFTPNSQGNLVAIGLETGSVIFWDLSQAREFGRVRLTDTSVTAIQFNPADSQVAIATLDSQVRLLTFPDLDQITELNGHAMAVNDLDFSPDGKTIASASRDNCVKVWRAEDGKELATLLKHTSSVRKVIFNHEGSQLASICDNGELWFWDASTHERSQTKWQLESAGVINPQFSHFVDWRASAKATLVVDIANRHGTILPPEVHGKPTDISFHPTGNLIVVTDVDGTVVVWDHENGREICKYSLNAKSARFLGNTRSILCNIRSGGFKVLPIEQTRFEDHHVSVTKVASSPDGLTIAAGDTTGSVRLIDPETGRLIRKLGVHIAEFGPPVPALKNKGREYGKTHRVKSRTVFRPGNDGKYAPDALREVWVFGGHTSRINAIEFSPDGKTIATAGDKTVRIWEVETGNEIRVLKHPAQVRDIAYGVAGKYLATACWDDAVRLFDLDASDNDPTVLVEHQDNVECVAFEPGGSRFASAGIDQWIRVWEIGKLKPIRVLKGHKSVVQALVFSDDGKRLASGSADGNIRIWEMNTEEMMELNQEEPVYELDFHPSHPCLISSTDSARLGEIRFWDLNVGRELFAFDDLPAKPRMGRFDPEGGKLIIAAGHRPYIKENLTDELPFLQPALVQVTEEDVRYPVKQETIALGYSTNISFPRIHASQPIRPEVEGQQLILVVVSMTREQLFPTREKLLALRKKAALDDPPLDVPDPRKSHSLYENNRFSLRAKSGEPLKAIATGPLPQAFAEKRGGGFHGGKLGLLESSTNIFKPHDRVLVGVVFDLSNSKGAFTKGNLTQLLIDQDQIVSVPSLDLGPSYKGGDHASNKIGPITLSETKTYTPFE